MPPTGTMCGVCPFLVREMRKTCPGQCLLGVEALSPTASLCLATHSHTHKQDQMVSPLFAELYSLNLKSVFFLVFKTTQEVPQ